MCWDTDSCNTMVVNTCRVLKFWSGHKYGGRCGVLMVSALDSRASGPGSSPGWGHLCTVVFLGRSHFTLTVPLSTQVYKWVLANLMLGGNPVMD